MISTISPPTQQLTFIWGGIWALGTALVVFLFFGHLGFSPTDEGYPLAISRRLLEDQMPYRDFITIRPLLTSLLHAPLVLLGGDYVLLLSRFVGGLQIAITTWLGIWLLRKEMAPHSSWRFYILSLTTAYFLTGSHVVYYHTWLTIDGVFLLLLGLTLLQANTATAKAAGYFLIGASCLAKQSFIFAIPIFLLLFQGWRDYRMVIASLLPGILFIFYLLLNDIIDDAWFQLTAVKGHFAQVAIKEYVHTSKTLGGFVTGVFVVFICRWKPLVWRQVKIILPVGLLLFVTAFIMNPNPDVNPLIDLLGTIGYPLGGLIIMLLIFYFSHKRYSTWQNVRIVLSILLLLWMIILIIKSTSAHSLPPFGAAVGIFIAYWLWDKVFFRILFALLAVAWMSSISLGPLRPVWICGVLAMAILMISNQQDNDSKYKTKMEWALAFVAFIAAVVFVNKHLNHIYREKEFSFLTAPLEGKFPGAAGIVSSPSMAAVYDDLQEMREKARVAGKRYAIVPEMSAWWIAADEVNPLPMDLSNTTELGSNNPKLVRRLFSAADAARLDTFFIVQKIAPWEIPRNSPGIIKWQEKGTPNDVAGYRDSTYVLLGHILDNYQLVDENEHFWLYQ